jgi:hypothetical protein
LEEVVKLVDFVVHVSAEAVELGGPFELSALALAVLAEILL